MNLPENRKFTWKIRVHSTAWETRTHFFWDFKRRQVGLSACSCSAALLGVPAEPQSWALGCPPHSWHLEQEERSSAPWAQEQHSLPQPRHSEGCLHCPTAAHTAPEQGTQYSAISDKHGSLLLCTTGALSRYPGDTQSTRSYLQSILTLPHRDHFSR